MAPSTFPSPWKLSVSYFRSPNRRSRSRSLRSSTTRCPGRCQGRAAGTVGLRLLSCRLEVVEPAAGPLTSVVLSPAENDRALLTAVDDTIEVGRYFGTSGTNAAENPDETDAEGVGGADTDQ